MLRCPRCSRADNKDPREGCIDNQTIGCPKPIEVVPGRDIVLVCRDLECCKQFAMPAASLMRRTIPSGINCQNHPCGILSTAPTETVPTTDVQQDEKPPRKGKQR